ncbi:hypothetical protein BGZ58_006803 [Dissophora ornata]|nr:hypothetical protein BGZ58_006803 [Dissophora ornata]
MIEESFTLIKNHVRDDSDPFNKFWDAVENLVLKISSPVAFTSIPLDGDDPMLLNSPSTEEPPPLSHGDTSFTDQGAGRELVPTTNNDLRVPQAILSQSQSRLSRSRGLDPSSMQESFFIIDSPSISNSQKGYSRNRSESASASLPASSLSSRPSSASLKRSEITARTSSKTLEEYAMENQQLKMSMDKLSKRNMKLEKNLEGVMQMSVWTKDVQRSAMQLIKSQDILRPVKQSVHDLSAGTEKGIALPQRPQTSTSSQLITLSASQTSSKPATMQARLLELEEEVLRLKLENSKLNSLMKKYKQRWEDLKESAKKRRSATSTPSDGTGEVSDGGGSTNSDPRSSSNRPFMQGSGASSPSNINPYASSTLVGNPNGSKF